MLDERGKALNSYSFSSLIAEVRPGASSPQVWQLGQCAQGTCWQAGDRNASSLVFCIGGPHGHSEAVRQRADSLVSLSPLVLNHQVGLGAARRRPHVEPAEHSSHHAGSSDRAAGADLQRLDHTEGRAVSPWQLGKASSAHPPGPSAAQSSPVDLCCGLVEVDAQQVVN